MILGLAYYVSIINTIYLKNFITEVPELYTSKGAILRSGMSFLAAVLFFLSLKFMKQYRDYKLYLYISIICLLLLPMSLIFPIPATRI